MNWGWIIGGGLLAYLWWQSQQASTTTTTTTSGTAATSTTTSPLGTGIEAPPAPVAAMTLAGMYAAITNAISAADDPNFTSSNGVFSGPPTDWTDYLFDLFPNSPVPGMVWPPDLSVVFPGVDTTQAMSGTTYWDGMSAYLSSKYGLSGLPAMKGSWYA